MNERSNTILNSRCARELDLRPKRTTVITICMLACALLLVSCGDSSGRFVDSDRERSFEIAGRVFRFPERYFWGSSRFVDGKTRSVNMMVLAPQFVPYDKELQYEFVECKGFCRRIYLSLNVATTPRHFTHFAKDLLSWKSHPLPDVGEATKSYSGLAYLDLINPRNTSSWGANPDRGYFYRCDVRSKPSPSCTVQADFDEEVTMRMAFSIELSGEIPTLLEKGRALVSRHQDSSKP